MYKNQKFNLSIFNKILIVFSLLFSSLIIYSDNANAAEKRVKFTNRYGTGVIVIKTNERKLYYTLGQGYAYEYPIAVGRTGMQRFGTTKVVGKKTNPDWYPTARMRREDPKLPERVPGGPSNPLGVRALYLGWNLYRIHGTNNPSSIGKAVSSGCYRMYNSDVIKLYNRVRVGTKVIVER